MYPQLAFRNVDVPDPTPTAPDGGSVQWNVLIMNLGSNDSGFIIAMDKAIDVFAGAFAGKFGENTALEILGKSGDVTAGAFTGGWVGALVAVGLDVAEEAVNRLTANCDGQVA